MGLPFSTNWKGQRCRSRAHDIIGGMTHDFPNHYYVRAIHPTTGEQVGFGQLTLMAASAKAAELRMSRYRDVVISISQQPPKAN
jgi:hypothetical protein